MKKIYIASVLLDKNETPRHAPLWTVAESWGDACWDLMEKAREIYLPEEFSLVVQDTGIMLTERETSGEDSKNSKHVHG